MNTPEPNTVGVVVGRFQVAKLHPGHEQLLYHAARQNTHLLVVLGTTSSLSTARNPLSYDMRKKMIEAALGRSQNAPWVTKNVVFYPLPDHPSDEIWSANLDNLIERSFPGYEATLYGSRNSFFSVYSGRSKMENIEEVPGENGTAYRAKAAERPLSSEEFRRGVIYTHATRLPIAYPAVDIAILRPERREVLLAAKEIDGDKRRFIGGFFDPALDRSFEEAAKREAGEETSGLEIGDIRYLGSATIDDWRYRGTGDTIVTSFFRATYVFGALRPADDICLLEWTPCGEVMNRLIETHRPLGSILTKHFS